jgi:hypothetical protein
MLRTQIPSTALSVQAWTRIAENCPFQDERDFGIKISLAFLSLLRSLLGHGFMMIHGCFWSWNIWNEAPEHALRFPQRVAQLLLEASARAAQFPTVLTDR